MPAFNERERRKLTLLINARATMQDLWDWYRSESDSQFDPERSHEGFWFDWDKISSQLMPEIGMVMSASRRTAQVEYTYPVYAVVFRTGDWFAIATNDQVESIRHLAVVDDGDVVETLNALQQMILSSTPDRMGEAMKHLNALRRILKLRS